MTGSPDRVNAVRITSTDVLVLTRSEALRLAEIVRQDLVCRTAAEIDDPIDVADITLTPAEAWRLVEELQESLAEIPGSGGLKGCDSR